MSSLDKSLDDIISTTRKSNPARKFGKPGKPTKVGKKVGASTKKPIVSFKKAGTAAAAAAFAAAKAKKQASTVDLSYATKVVVYNLPKDLKQDNVKDFFQSQVGGVQNVSMNYNEKGQFKGIATINFKSSNNATKAVEKYNGAPIDGGSSKLKLELIFDPTKKPLAARIAPNAPAKAPKIAAAKQQLKQQKKKPAPAKAAAAKAPQQKKKPVKKTKKTVEELDQEMADYFDN